MDKITGFLIRHYCLQQNISQEGLCKGVCVISYLSKIEQGLVQASEDIIHALFKALDIQYYDNAVFVHKYTDLIQTYFEKYYLEEDYKKELEAIEKVYHKLICSPLIISTYLLKIHEYIAQNDFSSYTQVMKKVAIFENYMNENQLFLFYLNHAYPIGSKDAITYLKKAGMIKTNSIQKYSLGHAYYHMGKNVQANEILQQAYHFASEEGNFHYMLGSALLLGNSYSNMRNDTLMLKYYKKCEWMARMMKRDDILSVIEYNIGSSFLQWNHLQEAKQYLLKSVEHAPATDVNSIFLNYQKLAILFRELEDEEEMMKYLELANSQEQNSKDEHMKKMHLFVKLYCEKERVYDEYYIQLLKELTFPKMDDMMHEAGFGFRYFHARYLMDVYKKKRLYKEALQLSEMFGNDRFS